MYVSATIRSGLGNRLFQVAAMLGYAEKHGCTPIFVKEWIKHNDHLGPASILDFFPSIEVLEKVSEADWKNHTETRNFVYTSIPPYVHTEHKNVCLKGYFQAVGYLPSHTIERPAILDGPIRENQAFLHIRRGDYLHSWHAHHCVDLKQFYRKALQLFDMRVQLLVCSDDIPWCKTMLPQLYGDIVNPSRWIFFDSDDVTTLKAMTACEYGGICANSTFSWWGAYWNSSPRKKICMPRTWGKPPLPEAKEIYPEGSIVL
jgi:Glycosyl transferase family 11